jgi:CheY-like chemotaxis protein
MRILAIDDDPFIVELFPKLSAEIGFANVVVVTSGDEAMAAITAAHQPFECILLDIWMPGKDGIELCAQIRSLPAYRMIPIILMTTMGGEAVIDRAFRAGATDYVAKPLDSFELDSKLRVAQAIIIAQHDAASALQLRLTNQVKGRTFALSEDTCVDGFGKVIDYPALKGHLIQMPRASLMSTQVVAIRIDHVSTILARATAEEFLYALSETADVISEAFKPFGYLIAYAGRGNFIVASRKVDLEPSILIEKEIQYLIDERSLEYDNGDPLDIDISIGNPIRPTVTRIHRIPKTFDRAIARAENRAARKMTEVRQPNIRMVG